MKKIFLLLNLLLIVNAGFSQAYIVTFIKGNVYHNNKPVKLHDRLDGATQITSDDKTAELALFSAQKGRLRLTFQNSKPAVVSRGAAKSSDLYQLIIGSYLQAYTTEKTLTARGAYSLEDFFNYMDRKHPTNRVFLAEGQRLPLTGYIDKFFICTIKGSDTLCTHVKIVKDSLVFDHQTIRAIAGSATQKPEPITCLIKHGYTNEGKYGEEYFSQPVQLTFLTTADLKSLVKSFAEGLDTYYGGDKDKLIADIEGQLSYYYGNCYEPGVKKVLAGLLK